MTVLPDTRSTQSTRVFVIGKDPVITHALTKLLELDEDIDVAGTAQSIGAAPIAAIRPDVVVLDTDGQPVDLPSTRSYLRRVAPETALTVLDSLRGMTVDELLHTVKGMSFNGSAARAHLRPITPEAPTPAPKTDISTLSERELEVVRLVAEGLSNKEISSRLSLSDKTVKNHISHILAKMNLTARTQVAVYAIRAGIV